MSSTSHFNPSPLKGTTLWHPSQQSATTHPRQPSNPSGPISCCGTGNCQMLQQNWISLNSTSNYLYYPGEERRVLYISTWQSIAAELGDIILDLAIICNFCHHRCHASNRSCPALDTNFWVHYCSHWQQQQGFPSLVIKSTQLSVQSIRCWVLIVFPPQPLLQDQITPSFNQRKKEKRVSAQGGFVFLDKRSFMKIAIQRRKLSKLRLQSCQ